MISSWIIKKYDFITKISALDKAQDKYPAIHPCPSELFHHLSQNNNNGPITDRLWRATVHCWEIYLAPRLHSSPFRAKDVLIIAFIRLSCHTRPVLTPSAVGFGCMKNFYKIIQILTVVTNLLRGPLGTVAQRGETTLDKTHQHNIKLKKIKMRTLFF